MGASVAHLSTLSIMYPVLLHQLGQTSISKCVKKQRIIFIYSNPTYRSTFRPFFCRCHTDCFLRWRDLWSKLVAAVHPHRTCILIANRMTRAYPSDAPRIQCKRSFVAETELKALVSQSVSCTKFRNLKRPFWAF